MAKGAKVQKAETRLGHGAEGLQLLVPARKRARLGARARFPTWAWGPAPRSRCWRAGSWTSPRRTEERQAPPSPRGRWVLSPKPTRGRGPTGERLLSRPRSALAKLSTATTRLQSRRFAPSYLPIRCA